MKLGDFGVSKRVREASNTSWHTSIEADCSAPEVRGLIGGDHAEDASYANPVDMWSLGYVVHWLLTKRYPVSAIALPRHCFKMTPLPLTGLADAGASAQALAFVDKLLQLNPNHRMTAQQACSHPWLAIADKQSLSSSETGRTDQASRNLSALPTSTANPRIVQQSAGRQFFGERPFPPSTDSSLTARDEVKKQEREIQADKAARIHEYKDRPPNAEESKFSLPPRRGGIIIKDPAGNIVNLKKSVSENQMKPTSAGEQIDLPRPKPISPEAAKNDMAADIDGNEFTIPEADLAAWEEEEERRQALEDQREVEYMKKKATQRRALRKHEREAAAAYKASLKEGERRAEAEEDRLLEERNKREHSEVDREASRLFTEFLTGSSGTTDGEKAFDSSESWSVQNLGSAEAGHEDSVAADNRINIQQLTSDPPTWEARFNALLDPKAPLSDTTSSLGSEVRLSKSQKQRQKKKQQRQRRQAGEG